MQWFSYDEGHVALKLYQYCHICWIFISVIMTLCELWWTLFFFVYCRFMIDFLSLFVFCFSISCCDFWVSLVLFICVDCIMSVSIQCSMVQSIKCLHSLFYPPYISHHISDVIVYSITFLFIFLLLLANLSETLVSRLFFLRHTRSHSDLYFSCSSDVHHTTLWRHDSWGRWRHIQVCLFQTREGRLV